MEELGGSPLARLPEFSRIDEEVDLGVLSGLTDGAATSLPPRESPRGYRRPPASVRRRPGRATRTRPARGSRAGRHRLASPRIGEPVLRLRLELGRALGELAREPG